MKHEQQTSRLKKMLPFQKTLNHCKINKFLTVFTLLSLSFGVMSATVPPQSEPTSVDGTRLLEKYGAKYIFKFSSRPSLRTHGVFSGKARNDKKVPVSLSLDFGILDENFYTDINLDHAVLLKSANDGSFEQVVFSLRRDTQSRCVLTWNSTTEDKSDYLFYVPAKTPDKKSLPRLDIPLFMNGGLLRGTGSYQLGSLYYPDFFDIDNDGKADLIAGSFHDFIRVYVNIAESPDAVPVFSENHSYVLADRDGKPIIHQEFHNCWMVSTPVFYDFSKNGHKDILLGGTLTFPDVWYVENIGTDKVPVYVKKHKIDLPCADGYKDGLYPVPCDLNGDGKMDLIAGSLARGGGDERFIYYFEGLSDNPTDFKFKDGVKLQDHTGKAIRVPGYSQCSVAVFDWTGNGLEDVFVVSAGNLLFFENHGSKTSPKLVPAEFPEIGVAGRGSLKVLPGKDVISGSSAVLNKNLGDRFKQIPLMMLTPSPVSLSGHGTFHVLDFNGDGRNDIIYSTDWGNIVCATNNNGTWNKRIMKSAGEPINSRGCVDPGENNKGYARMTMGDLDGDGLPDLLINHELSWRFGYLAFFKNLGNGEFAAESRLDIPPFNFLQYRDGKHGKAALFDTSTPLDYFSYPSSEIFETSGGMVSLNISPSENSPWSKPMSLFHNQDFKMDNNLPRFGDEFKVELMKDGSISWRAGKSQLQSPPIKWHKNTWYSLLLKWNKSGMSMAIDGKEIAKNNAHEFQNKPGPRIYIGSSQSVSFVQPEREYPFRIKPHEHEYKDYHPFRGLINNVEIASDSDKTLFKLPLNGTNDAIAPQSGKIIHGGSLNIAYRSAPAVVDINGNGLLDLVLPIAVGSNNRHSSEARLYWFENIGTKSIPRFAQGVLLPSDQKAGIDAGVRSSMRFADWDGDGDQDLFLMKTSGVTIYYSNEGTAEIPKFNHRGTIINQNWGHESGVDVVDWNKDGQLELIVMNGDNGNLLFYNKPFLDKLEPEVMLREIVAKDKTLMFPKTDQKEFPLVVNNLTSDDKNDSTIKNICNGVREGASSIGYWQKGFPGKIIFNFTVPQTISRVDCYFGHPLHAKRDRGDRCPKSYQFEYWDGAAWKPLFPKVEAGPNGNGEGIGRTASFSFPERKTDKIRLEIYSSYDNAPSVPENKRAAFIREIEFFQ